MRYIIAAALLLLAGVVRAQDSVPRFTATYRRLDTATVEVIITARVQPGVHLFSTVKVADSLPYSTVTLDSALTPFLAGSLKEQGNLQKEASPDFKGAEVHFFADSVQWIQDLKISASRKKTVEGTVTYLAKVKDQYLSDVAHFSVTVPAEAPTAPAGPAEKSLWFIFVSGLLAGFGAFVSPCIYAMVPVTVSFFTKRSTSRAKGIQNALYYSLSIMLVYTLFGFLITLIFGQGALNSLASSAIFNIVVFLMFLIFGISFLGAFEITLPSSISNRVDAKAGLGSFSGLFFMALTLVVVSFSCTVPFIGGLAVLTTHGGKVAPIVGFFGFSLALALPFALFAFFPSLLNQLAKSGGWLMTVKVTLGFIELALALKFLSSADLAYHWRILDREVYLSLWIVIFGLLGFYLLGKLKFAHDQELPVNDYGIPHLTIPRLFFAIAALTFTVYMIPGLWGAPLNGISAWLPEMKTQDFNLNRAPVAVPAGPTDTALRPRKYTDFLESEIKGVSTFFDYTEAVRAASLEHKPLLIDFTGHSCANCRKMERAVLNDPEVIKALQDHFVVVSLYVDDKYRLPEDEWVTSKNDGSTIEYMGARNLDFEVGLTGNNSQPQYVFVDPVSGKVLLNAGGYDPDVPRFLKILSDVQQQFK
ncbi:protein-disulfide reductase DsbD family protein [Dinghuibacter silviterrae]|uniref:Thiol:disulfide interchange protein DsbD n=1 Tax=Dinghuibacter silviterrae TaxID=1539049 RepID=A0A4V3GLP1_9BACT|nr:thioredoxin family protein [Dinghuibacter silviterrae]TDX00273.1 thiol:disulfide interchange protein DsbD [Dinghuibacter silviterrae]